MDGMLLLLTLDFPVPVAPTTAIKGFMGELAVGMNDRENLSMLIYVKVLITRCLMPGSHNICIDLMFSSKEKKSSQGPVIYICMIGV